MLDEQPKIESMNGYTCIDDVVVNINPQDKDYMSSVGKINKQLLDYVNPTYLKRPQMQESLDCKDIYNLLSVIKFNGSAMDIRVIGTDKKAKQVALDFYKFLISGNKPIS